MQYQKMNYGNGYRGGRGLLLRQQVATLLWIGLVITLSSAVAYFLLPYDVREFVGFSALFGVFILLLWGAKQCEPRTSKKLGTLLWVIFYMVSVGFVILELVVLLNARDSSHGEPQVMIVLGTQVYEEGPSPLLMARLDTAHEYWKRNPHVTILVSGGQGDNEPTTEAHAMEEYLVDLGVPQESILQEDESRNTFQNLSFSYELLDSLGYDTKEDMLVVSNEFHLARAKLLWKRVFPESTLSVLSAPSSDSVAKMKGYIREAPALVKSWIFDRPKNEDFSIGFALNFGA